MDEIYFQAAYLCSKIDDYLNIRDTRSALIHASERMRELLKEYELNQNKDTV